MYLVHVLFFCGALAFSWQRSKSILHPHFMFTAMICVQLVDFLVRGYDDRNLLSIPEFQIYKLQLILLSIFGMAVFATSLISNPKLETLSRNAGQHLRVTANLALIIFGVALLILAADLYKRLSTVGWSVGEVINQSLMPRGQRDWDQAQFGGNFVFAITSIMLPLAGIASGFLLSVRGSLLRIPAFLVLLFVLLLLVTNGSRTPVVVTIAATSMFIFLQQRSRLARTGVLALSAAAIAVLTSLMYLFRSYGFTSNELRLQDDFELTFHMDDNYYRAIFAFDYADRGLEFWDPIFFFTTIFANPIPRAIWPNKPLFSAEFFGGYKLDYVTNLFAGEVVAMTGVYLSMVAAPLIALLLYYVLFKAQTLIRRPMGLGVYLIWALYAYMCVRSLPNLTHFLYLPFFATLLLLVLGRQSTVVRPVLIPPSVYRPRSRWR
jgi:hypothetical protein